MNTTKFS